MARQSTTTTTASTKHPGGRPTKLTPELVEKAREYLATNDRLGEQALLPTVERLSIILDVHRDTLYEWAKHDAQFSDILRNLMASQADKLLQYGLAGRYNSTIAKLILTKHGYVEKQETDLRVKEMPKPILGGESQNNGGGE